MSKPARGKVERRKSVLRVSEPFEKTGGQTS